MTEEKLIDHIISRLEPQILDYVEVRNPQTTSNPLQLIDKYEERFLNRKIRGSSWESRDIQPNENNRFSNRNRQENWRETRGNNRYADNSRPRLIDLILTSHCSATRGLLATDHVILNHGQVTWTTPELAPPSPNYHTTPTGGRFSSRQI
ncbi:uncharacterized protein TNCV_24701 [Trichonephila clavipes]|uniref:Uncharacterized protein n=1 Tax=Trichonephila clavipes TaxID=2585209 RepID=A0A8X6W0Z3_TRICX|nr:uncharacterized protein TNCV_24701 [Trichonephila clavipes]